MKCLQVLAQEPNGQYKMAWYATVGNSKKAASPTFYMQPGKHSCLSLEGDQLVHVFQKLTGSKKSQGKIPAKEMKVIKAVALAGADALANGQVGCCACREVIDDEMIACALCERWRHLGCTERPVVEGETWFCEDCWED